MKPCYTNQFFCSRNPVSDAVVIEFKHAYIESSSKIEDNKVLTNMSNVFDDVSSICLTYVDALSLRDTLNTILADNINQMKNSN